MEASVYSEMSLTCPSHLVLNHWREYEVKIKSKYNDWDIAV